MGIDFAPPTINADDKVVFLESIRPPLRDGDYTATITQVVQKPEDSATKRTEIATARFSVTGDRFSLAHGLVEQVFPPNGSTGPFDRALPHVVLQRETLPWERSPHGEGHEEPYTPSWLALLVFFDTEIPAIEQVLSEELEKDLPAELVHDPKSTAIVIHVPWETLKTQIPTYEDLGLNAHARMVKSGDEVRNLRSVIVAQRLVRSDAQCTVHLVSLEHSYVIETHADPPPAGPVTDLLNEAWATLSGTVSALETQRLQKGPAGRHAGNRLKTLEAEIRIPATGVPQILSPIPGDHDAIPLNGHAAAATGALDDGTMAVTRAGKPTVLNAKGLRVECDELVADFTPAPKRPPKTPPARLPAEIAALLKDRPANAVRAHLRDGMPAVWFTAAPSQAKPSVLQVLDAVLPDPLWRNRLEAVGSIRFERWWVFDGVPRRLIVEATDDAVTLTIRPQAQLTFRHTTGPVRLVSLYNWSFKCSTKGAGHFGPRAMALFPPETNDGCLRLPQDARTADFPAEAQPWLDAGYTALPHFLRTGESTVSWYRGPLAASLPVPPPEPNLPATCADALLLFDPQLAMFDASWAAAWELGRQLAVADRKFSHSLALWKRAHREAQYAVRRRLDANYLSVATPRPEDTAIPSDISEWLDRVSLLEGVPFAYLVPDERMLPVESLRFFTLDPGWIESLRDGALSIARVHASDHARHDVHREQIPSAAPERISGVIIRSSIVKDWPNLTVRGWVQTSPNDTGWETKSDLAGHEDPYAELTAVRQVHLGPEILLVLFKDKAGLHRELNILEMHVQPQMLHFGLEGASGNWYKDLHDPQSGDPLRFNSTRAGLPGERVLKATLSLAKLKKLSAQKGLDKDVDAALDRRAQRWKEDRVWEREGLENLRKGIPSAQTKLDEKVAKKVAALLYGAATKLVEESVPVTGIAWRDQAAQVLDLSNLFQLLADRMRPVVGNRAVTTGDFALQMLDAPAVVRVRRELTK